jgi:hypothetical protein
MPYFVHRKGADITEEIGTFTDRAQAHKFATETTATSIGHVAYVVTFKVSSAEVDAWQTRESERFESGDYMAVPWQDMRRPPSVETHYVHLSIVHPGMVAYTPSDEHGVQDRQVRLKPGKYLAQFYETPGLMTHQDVQSYVARCQSIEDNSKLAIARDADTIVRIYSGTDPAPMSCMHPDNPSHYIKTGTGNHPCRVYGDSDLGIAYFGPIDSVEARAICWPDKKRYGRVYGTRRDSHVGTKGETLKRLLEAAGYESGSMKNARVRAIDYHGGYLMPYVDGIETASDLGNGYIRLDDDGPISTSETQGYTEVEDSDCDEDDEDDEPDTMTTCNECNRTYDSADSDGETDLCQRCYDNMWTCEHCDDRQFDRSVDVSWESWCQSCFDGSKVTCQDDDCGNEWIKDSEFYLDEQTARTKHGTSDLCRSCADRYTWCDHCETSYEWRKEGTYDDLMCHTCGRSPRCEKTIDLLTVKTTDTYKLEVFGSENHPGVWSTCHWIAGDNVTPDVGLLETIIAARERAQEKYPHTQYRVVPFEVTSNVASL